MYKVLSEESIREWQKRLDSMVIELLENPSKTSLEMFLIILNEYLFASIGYTVKCEGVPTENVKVSLSDVKKAASSSEMSSDFRFLKDTADNLRHFWYNQNIRRIFYALINRDSLNEIWEKFLPADSEIKSLLLNHSKLLVIYNELFDRESFFEYCKKKAEVYLNVSSNSKSEYTVIESINKVCKDTLCGKNFSMQVVLEIVKDQYVIE